MENNTVVATDNVVAQQDNVAVTPLVAADKSTTKKAAKPKAVKAAIVKHAKMGVDRFGTRKGTYHAAVNAMLRKDRCVTMAQVQKKCGRPTCYNHLHDLCRRGLVVQTYGPKGGFTSTI